MLNGNFVIQNVHMHVLSSEILIELLLTNVIKRKLNPILGLKDEPNYLILKSSLAL